MQNPNQRLKAAVHSEEVPPFLGTKVRAAMGAAPRPSRWVLKLAPAAMALAVVAALGVSYQLGHLRMTVKSQEAYVESVSNRVGLLMRAGLQDHIHCAIFRKYPKVTPTPQEFVEHMGAKYAGLVPIVRKQIPSTYKLVIAHQCLVSGRRFLHLSLMDSSKQMSLVITRKRDGESFDIEGVVPALVQSGIPMYKAGVQRFQIAAFETDSFLAYFVSDLSAEKNAELMAAMAPEVKSYLEKL